MITEGFNDFFVNVGPKLASSIPSTINFFSEYLSNPIKQNFIFANVTPETIFETLSLLKSKVSCGKDNISTKLLKDIMPSVIFPVFYLFNLYLITRFLPDSFKCAKVIPIFKSGAPHVISQIIDPSVYFLHFRNYWKSWVLVKCSDL